MYIYRTGRLGKGEVAAISLGASVPEERRKRSATRSFESFRSALLIRRGSGAGGTGRAHLCLGELFFHQEFNDRHQSTERDQGGQNKKASSCSRVGDFSLINFD
jgi:hypothetical protein